MIRRIRALALLAAILLGLAPAALRAQSGSPPGAGQDAAAPAEGEASSGGDPLYGYIGTAFLAAGAIFVVCKSARR
jgi:hypothetical protein